MSRRAIWLMCLLVSAIEIGLDFVAVQQLRIELRLVFEATMILFNMIFVYRSVQRKTADESELRGAQIALRHIKARVERDEAPPLALLDPLTIRQQPPADDDEARPATRHLSA